jgi:TrmH family RNA methyltransferase
MGSLARVNVHYVNLEQVLPQIKLPLYGAMLDGQNMYTTNFGDEGLLVMGNEGNGVSPVIERLINTKITIPRAGKAESLNVAIATAILCSEIKRNSMK